MREWRYNRWFNNFNSAKGLMYKQWYDAILTGKFLPPVEASIDPVNDCPLNCFWCNSKIPKKRKVKMTREHLLELCRFFKDWGIKGVCFAGGGEPTMHENLGEAIQLLYSLGIPSSIITNGLFLGYNQMNDVASFTEWCGVSIDAATPQTYKKIKGHDRFNEVIKNIRYIVSHRPKEITYKFLIHPINQHEIYNAICLARNIGCNRIHIRPVGFLLYQDYEDDYDIAGIEKQIEAGIEDFESSHFEICAITHKYNETMHRKFNFSKCLGTPIMPIFQADGWMTACIDRKGDDSLRLCRHDNPQDILDFWGSNEHKRIIDKINIEECGKCTINYINEQIEHAVKNNEMQWEFP